jgi:ABC-type glycerol-3-phosphate transport system substrate-binding protein
MVILVRRPIMHSALRYSIVGAAGVVITGALTGCGSATGDDEPQELGIMISSNGAEEDAAWEGVVAAFEDEHPDIDVTFESMNTTDYSTVLKTRVLGGAGPDLYKFDGNAAFEFIEQGFAMDVVGTPAFEGLSQGVKDLSLMDTPVEGATFSVPIQQAGNGIVYNTDLFDEAGIDELPQTYSEFVDVCERLDAAGITPLAMSAREDWWPQFIIYYAAAQHVFGENPEFNFDVADGDVTYADSEGWRRTLEILDELSPFYLPDALGTDQAGAQSAFLQGKAAMFPAPWILPEARSAGLEIGYFNFPTTDDPDEESIWGAPQVSMAINPDNGREDLAIEFLTFLMSDEQYGEYLGALASFPTRDGVEMSEDEPLNQVMADAWEGKTFVPTLTPPNTGVQAALLPAMQDLLAGKATVDDVLAAMDKGLARNQ